MMLFFMNLILLLVSSY